MRPNPTALAYATIAAIWLVVGMTILAEQQESFKTLLTSLAGHHWVGKSIASAIAFVLVYLLFSRVKESGKFFTLVLAIAGSVVLGGLSIFFFYVSHFLAG